MDSEKTALPAAAAMEGEILLPGGDNFEVTYWRHYAKRSAWRESVEDCLEFLKFGSQYGELSDREAVVMDRSGAVVLDADETQRRLRLIWHEEDDE